MWNLRYAIACGVLLIALEPARAEAGGDAARDYFGHINVVPCEPGGDQCKRITDRLASIDRTCTEAGRACRPADELLREVFGDTYRPSLPDYVVYFEQRSTTPGRRKFVQHTPVLMWNRENTPHLYGVQDVYAVVFTERKACLTAHATTTYRNEPNPLSAVLAALGSKPDSAAPKPAERSVGQFTWFPMSGDPDTTGMWLAIARFAVDENSTVRLTVEYSQPRAGKASSDSDKGKSDPPEECAVEPEPKPGDGKPATGAAAGGSATDGKGGARADRYSGDFLAANAFFSNSPGGCATVAFGLGGSYSVRGTSVSSGGSKIGLNGYAMAKLYLLPPRILAGPRHNGGRRPSLGLFVGTGVKSPFDELVFELSVGHVIGNLGVMAGGNSIAAAKESTSGRKMCAFAGIEYSF